MNALVAQSAPLPKATYTRTHHGWHCVQCGHQWEPRPRAKRSKPADCPKCRSEFWDDAAHVTIRRRPRKKKEPR